MSFEQIIWAASAGINSHSQDRSSTEYSHGNRLPKMDRIDLTNIADSCFQDSVRSVTAKDPMTLTNASAKAIALKLGDAKKRLIEVGAGQRDASMFTFTIVFSGSQAEKRATDADTAKRRCQAELMEIVETDPLLAEATPHPLASPRKVLKPMVIDDDCHVVDKSETAKRDRDVAVPTITVASRLDDFATEARAGILVESAGQLFCKPCGTSLRLKKSTIVNHLDSSSHVSSVDTWKHRKESNVLVTSMFQKAAASKGSHVELEVKRFTLVRAFMAAGIPVAKLSNAFIAAAVFDLGGLVLPDARLLRDQIPKVLAKEKLEVKSEISDSCFGVIFDGASRLGEVMVIVVRWVNQRRSVNSDNT